MRCTLDRLNSQDSKDGEDILAFTNLIAVRDAVRVSSRYLSNMLETNTKPFSCCFLILSFHAGWRKRRISWWFGRHEGFEPTQPRRQVGANASPSNIPSTIHCANSTCSPSPHHPHHPCHRYIPLEHNAYIDSSQVSIPSVHRLT